jgi:hypothetical protein
MALKSILAVFSGILLLLMKRKNSGNRKAGIITRIRTDKKSFSLFIWH